jgi:CheY-like chemotaxis protein
MIECARRRPLVLFVEERDEEYERYSDALADDGYEVFGVADEREAVEAALALWPDVIVFDFVRARDGGEAARRIRADPHTRAIPFVILTRPLTRDRLLEEVRRPLEAHA